MPVTRSKFLPSFGEPLRLVDALIPLACLFSFAFGFLLRGLLTLALVSLTLSAEPATKRSEPPAPLPACEAQRVILSQRPAPVATPTQHTLVAERPPRVDRYWPERRMYVAPDFRDPNKWVREQEKEAWRFVDSIGK